MNHFFRKPVVCLITTGEATSENFSETKYEILEDIAESASEGVSLIQIREKQLPAKLLFELAHEAAAIVSGTNAKLLINDRADVAVAARADGVHLASNSVPAKIVRRSFGPDRIIGVSTHSLEEVLKAATGDADFAVYAPVFASPGKGEAKGLEELARICSAAGDFPVLALGGIDDSNFESVLEAGAAGFAAIRALTDSGSRVRIMDRLESGQPLR